MTAKGPTPSNASYGIDSPLIVVTFASGAGAMLVIGVLTALGGGLAAAVGPFAGALLLGGAALFMVAGSRSGKGRLWDGILDDLALGGKERALDVGCGRGLVTVKLAQRLGAKKVSAVDIWRPRDQTGNSRAAAEANFTAEGVADRIELRDADMRELPYPDASFDLVTASMALHHLPLAADRGTAMKEIIRVTKPGGRVVIADVGKTFEYAAWLEDAKFDERTKSGLRFATYPPMRIVSGRKPKR